MISQTRKLANTLRKAKAPFYVGICVISAGSILLGKRREDGIWTSPGGGGEPDESPSQTAIREAWEEANLPLREEELKELAPTKARDGKPIHLFFVELPEKDRRLFDIHSKNDPDEETPGWHWFNPRDIHGLKMDPNRKETVMRGLMKYHGLSKAIASNPTAAIDFDTTDLATEELVSGGDSWVGQLDLLMEHCDFGDIPREMELPEYRKLYLSKVDDGIYSGFVKNSDPESGSYGETLFRIEKMTLPALVQALKGKEYLPRTERVEETPEETPEVEKDLPEGQAFGSVSPVGEAELATEGLSKDSEPQYSPEASALAERLLAGLQGDVHLHFHKSKKVEKEGSRGGVIIGHRPDGSPIYESQKSEKTSSKAVKKISKKYEGFLKEESKQLKKQLEALNNLKTLKSETILEERKQLLEGRLREIQEVFDTGVMKEDLYLPFENNETNKKTNMIGMVKIPKALAGHRQNLLKYLNDANKIIDSIGIKFKRPLKFELPAKNYTTFSGDYTAGTREIRLTSWTPESTTLMHEIGHAVDDAMSSGFGFRSDKIPSGKDWKHEKNEQGTPTLQYEEISKEILKLHEDLEQIIRKTPLYRAKHKTSRKKYLTEKAEIFARAFEIYTLGKANQLLQKGEISSSFIKGFYPEVFSSANSLSEIVEKLSDQQTQALISEITDIMDKIFSKEQIKKAEVSPEVEDLGEILKGRKPMPVGTYSEVMDLAETLQKAKVEKEGSRGGIVIGHREDGSPIYESQQGHPNMKQESPEEKPVNQGVNERTGITTWSYKGFEIYNRRKESFWWNRPKATGDEGKSKNMTTMGAVVRSIDSWVKARA